MARRILNRKELRADFDAAEQRKQDEEEQDEVEEEEEEEEAEADEEVAAEDEEEPVKAPKKRKAPAKPRARSRAAKITRMKVVWGVFDNSNRRIAVYDYPKRQDAYDHAAKLTADKKTTYFVQPVKEPIEVKKEE